MKGVRSYSYQPRSNRYDEIARQQSDCTPKRHSQHQRSKVVLGGEPRQLQKPHEVPRWEVDRAPERPAPHRRGKMVLTGVSPLTQKKQTARQQEVPSHAPEYRKYEFPLWAGASMYHAPTVTLGRSDHLLLESVDNHLKDFESLKCGGSKNNNLYGASKGFPMITVIDVHRNGQYGMLVLHQGSAAFIGKVWKAHQNLQQEIEEKISSVPVEHGKHPRVHQTDDFLYGKSYASVGGPFRAGIYEKFASSRPMGELISRQLRESNKLNPWQMSGKDLAAGIGHETESFLKDLYENDRILQQGSQK